MEGPIINKIENLKDKDIDNIYKINEQPFVVNAIENLSFIKDFTELPDEKDRAIAKFLMDSAKNSPNFEESVTLVETTTDLIYRPFTIEDFFIKEVNPRTLTQNTILSHLCRNGRRISDLCTGLWGFTKNALDRLDIKSNGFDLEAEIAGLARRNKVPHTEVGVQWSQRKGGTSKLRSLTDGFIIFLRILRT